MRMNRVAVTLGSVAILTLTVAAPALAVTRSGSINCANVAAVQARTTGATYVAPPGEGEVFRGNFATATTTTTYEAEPSGTAWSARAGTVADASTYAYCTNLGW
jgi:hypothetical protein